MQSTHSRLSAAIAIAIGLALAGCSSSGAEIALVASETKDDPFGMVGFALPGNDVTADAPTLIVTANEDVTVTLENAHGQYSPTGDSHDFMVVRSDLPDIATLAATGALADEALWGSATGRLFTGESAEVTFTPDEPGTYLYICSIPGHADSGMTGNFLVEA